MSAINNATNNANNLLLVSTTFPADQSPEALIQALLKQRLAACVQCLPPMQSYYHWEGKIQTDSEQLLLIKTSAEKYSDLQRLIEQQHPYNVPEIIATPITEALPAYREWAINELMAEQPKL